MPLRKDSKQIVSRDEHGETRPAHRIAGGTRFDGEVESGRAKSRGVRAAIATTRKGAKKKQADNLNHALEEIMDEDGNIRYDE